MSALNRATLTLEADPDNDGSTETGVFEMAGELTVTPGVRTGFLVNGQGAQVNSIISQLVNDGALDDSNKRRGFYVDLGGGQHTVEIEFLGWKGSQDAAGNDLQWGDDPQPGRSQTSATGQDPITQIDVLTRYLTTGTFDSQNPATLEYGEFSSQGLYDPLEVVIEGPQATREARDDDAYTGRMVCIAAAAFDDYYDATERLS